MDKICKNLLIQSSPLVLPLKLVDALFEILDCGHDLDLLGPTSMDRLIEALNKGAVHKGSDREI